MSCAGIDHEDHDVRALDRLQRLHHRKLLHRLEHLAALAYSRGVDERVALPVPVELDLDRVARGARLVEGDDALLADEAVHERGLADVRAADDGHARMVGFELFVAFFGKFLERILDELAHAFAVLRRDRDRIAHRELVEFRRDDGLVHALGLVDDEEGGRGRLAQGLGDALVLRREAARAVDDEEDHVGFRNRLACLARHLGEDAVLRDRLEAARVDDDERLRPEPPLPVMTVPREPRAGRRRARRASA
jgi:hypothetical protein